MIRAFNAVMRVISSLIGVLMVLMGGIWIVQGLNLSLQCPRKGQVDMFPTQWVGREQFTYNPVFQA